MNLMGSNSLSPKNEVGDGTLSMSAAATSGLNHGLSRRLQDLTTSSENLRASITLAQLRGLQRREPDPTSDCTVRFGKPNFFLLEEPVSGICLANTSQVVLCCGASIRCIDWSKNPEDQASFLCKERLSCVAASSAQDNSVVAWGSLTGTLWLWRPPNNDVHINDVPVNAPINDIHFHPNSSTPIFCTAAENATATLWNAELLLPLRIFKQHTAAVTGVRMLGAEGNSHQDRCIATACCDGLVRVWDARSPTLLFARPTPVQLPEKIRRPGMRLETMQSSQLLLAASDTGHLSAWDLRTRRRFLCVHLAPLVEDHNLEITCLAASPCDEYLAFGDTAGSVRCIELGSCLDSRTGFLVSNFQNDLNHTNFANNIQNTRLVGNDLKHNEMVTALAWGRAEHPFLLACSYDEYWSCTDIRANQNLVS